MKFIKDLKANLSLVVSKAFLKKAAYFFGTVALITALLAILPDPAVKVINTVAWVSGNVVLVYTALALLVFLASYYAIFDPSATTGGKLIFRFMLSMAGVILLVFIGIFVDPSPDREWFKYPDGTVEWWRPLLRLAVYGFVTFSISSLAWLLAVRKWWPHRVKKASDINLVKVRHTAEIPIVRAPDQETTSNT